MAVFREQPYGNFNFLVDVGTGNTESVQAGFSEVVLPEATVEVIEYRNGNDKISAVRKIPGRVQYGNVILKRGMIGTLDLYEWWDQVRTGAGNYRRAVTIQLLNEDRSSTVLVWKLINAWPMRYTLGSLVAPGNDVAIESIELCHEGLFLE